MYNTYACLLDTSSLIWLKAIKVDNQNYIKHFSGQLSWLTKTYEYAIQGLATYHKVWINVL